MDADSLKTLFSQPLMLLVLMLFGSLLSAAKQLVVARRQGSTVSAVEYVLKVETLIMLCGNFAAWLGLLYSDLLNPLAVLAGYVINDAADAATKSGRSAAISPTGSDPKP